MHVGLCGVLVQLITAELQVRLPTAAFEVPSNKKRDTGPEARFLRFLIEGSVSSTLTCAIYHEAAPGFLISQEIPGEVSCGIT